MDGCKKIKKQPTCRLMDPESESGRVGTFTTGAKQLVVHEAHVMIGMSAVILLQLTPMTTLRMFS